MENEIENHNKYLVITSIVAQGEVICLIAKKCLQHDLSLILIGDAKSPSSYYLEGCDYYSLDRQYKSDFEFARVCPVNHYARKNVGYLLAMAKRASSIMETDDDNLPLDAFWTTSERFCRCPTVLNGGWVNIYSYFSDRLIWPRGFPLKQISNKPPLLDSVEVTLADCPIQQGLADENPDVDAIYRLLFQLPHRFSNGSPVALSNGSWCPFNSQNTVWWPVAFKLMYLPAYCSFRMTDIWRSFIAQRIAWLNNWSVLFRPATVVQKRNEHDLMKDFEQEVPGYLNNSGICEILENLPLKAGYDEIGDNMRICYEKMVEMALVRPDELDLLEVWLKETKLLGY
jgi:hypothetical protein